MQRRLTEEGIKKETMAFKISKLMKIKYEGDSNFFELVYEWIDARFEV